MRRFILLGATVAASAAAFSMACSGGATASSNAQAVSGSDSGGSCATPVVVDQSLFITNNSSLGQAALANFSFENVLDAIIDTGAQGSGQTALQLFQQMVGTMADPPCTGTINGFPVDCPRAEGTVLETINPFQSGKKGFMSPVALVNRFDLAPDNGANCGQYRVVFAIPLSLEPSQIDRFLMIFEAVLPNPQPDKKLKGCLPVAAFWDSLSAPGISSTTFASELQQFYFTGINFDGVQIGPVITAQAYGIGGPTNTNTGQIRVNMLSSPTEKGVDGQWQLREFTLSQSCTTADGGNSCTLTGNNTFVKNNPFGGLFSTTGDENGFQTEFLKQVKTLASNNFATISMTTPDVDNAGQSSEQDDTNDYSCLAGFAKANGDPGCGTEKQNTSLANAIQAKLADLGLGDAGITPTDILQRATTQSCAGCHQLSPGTLLGGSFDAGWPASNGFTQIDEEGDESPALTNVFLPFRSDVLTTFIDKHCAADGGVEDDGDGTLTVGGQATGSSN